MSVIDDYLNKLSSVQRTELERIRVIVKEIAPDSEETLSYGVPTFKVKKQPLVYIGVFKNHMSLFPTSGPTKALKDKLKDFDVSKGTIRFTIEKPIPEKLIKEILHIRLADIYNN